jgi:hypothetical protein
VIESMGTCGMVDKREEGREEALEVNRNLRGFGGTEDAGCFDGIAVSLMFLRCSSILGSCLIGVTACAFSAGSGPWFFLHDHRHRDKTITCHHLGGV